MQYSTLIRQNHGFTEDSAGNSPKTGYMVSLKGKEVKLDGVSRMSDLRLNEVCKVYYNQIDWKPNLYFGAWVDGDDLYLDVSTNIEDREVAIAFGRANEQRAIWSIDNMESIRLTDES